MITTYILKFFNNFGPNTFLKKEKYRTVEGSATQGSTTPTQKFPTRVISFPPVRTQEGGLGVGMIPIRLMLAILVHLYVKSYMKILIKYNPKTKKKKSSLDY